MKNFPISSFRSGLNGLLKMTVTLMGTMAVSTGASFGSFLKQADSPLPIEVVHSGSGQIRSVQLIGPAGNVIAEKQDAIDPMHPCTAQSRGGYFSYVASFPLSDVRQAARIRVVYHGDAHRKTNS